MSNYVVNGEKLTAIADAIRAKTGGTENLTLDQMPTEIAGIETETEIPDGYIIPSGSMDITENGEYDVTEKASAVVAVPETEITLQNKEITENGTYTADTGYDGLGQVTVNVASSGGGDADADELMESILTRSFTEINLDATNVGDHAFGGCKSLRSINLPNATRIGSYSFYNCSALTDVTLPNVEYLGSYAFSLCSGLQSINLPKVTSLQSQALYSCSSLREVNLPNLVTVASQVMGSCKKLESIVLPSLPTIGNYMFSYDDALRKVDAPIATSVSANAFAYCYKFTTLILRSSTMCTLANTNAFNSCYHFHGTTNSSHNPSGAKDGYIYVPRALVDTYKAASNWSTYASQIRALEDYTVDGTTTGALDESKI